MKISSVVAVAVGVGAVAIVVALFLAIPLPSVPAGDEKGSPTLIPLLTQRPEQIAKQIVEAAGDEIMSLRLNDTDALRVIAYTTAKGDIILPIDRMDEGVG